MNFLRQIFDPRFSARVMAGAMLAGYSLLPLWFYYTTGVDDAFDQLAGISTLSAVCVLAGFHLYLAGKTQPRKIVVSLESLILVVWIPFLISTLVIVATARREHQEERALHRSYLATVVGASTT